MLLVSLVAAASGPDHQIFASFLDGAVYADGVDYATLHERRAALQPYLDALSQVDIETLSTAEQVALWVNAYNAHTLATVLDAGRPQSIRDLDGGEVWKRRTFTVAGQALTLDAIEHQRARPLMDGRVHAVVNCASKGCPPLPPEPLSPTELDAQLDAAARRWVATNAYSWAGDTLQLSKIFDWYAVDFTAHAVDGVADSKVAGAIGFVTQHVAPAEAARVRAAADGAGWQAYDWTLNSR